MKNIKIILSYEGTNYLGWQKTKMGPSIEETLESSLSQILRHPVTLQAASRTDAGVHAEEQVVNFFTPSDFPLDKLKKSLNGTLPKDISVSSVQEMNDSFHPTLDALKKKYHYQICLGRVQLPFYRFTSWHFPLLLNIEEMQASTPEFIGLHDFSAFSNEKTENGIRELFSIDVSIKESNRLQISVEGNRFLYKMVRNIVGTLVYVGCGKIKRSEISSILKNKDRTQAGMTAPAHGLFLKQVYYD